MIGWGKCRYSIYGSTIITLNQKRLALASEFQIKFKLLPIIKLIIREALVGPLDRQEYDFKFDSPEKRQ